MCSRSPKDCVHLSDEDTVSNSSDESRLFIDESFCEKEETNKLKSETTVRLDDTIELNCDDSVVEVPRILNSKHEEEAAVDSGILVFNGKSDEAAVSTSGNCESTKQFNAAQNILPVPIEDTISENAIRFKCLINLQVTCEVTYGKESGLICEKEVKEVKVVSCGLSNSSDSDNKRASSGMSSSGSVYSDNVGIPYPLPPRVSIASIQTSSTSTNEDVSHNTSGMVFSVPEVKPWKHDCLLSLACDKALRTQILLTPKRKRGRPKKSETASGTAPKKSTRRKSMNVVIDHSQSLQNNSLLGRDQDPLTSISKEDESLEQPATKSTKKGRSLRKGLAASPVPGPSGLCSDKRKRKLKTNENSSTKKLKQGDSNTWNALPGLDVEGNEPNATRAEEMEMLGPLPTKPVFIGMRFLLCYVNFENRRSVKSVKAKISSNSDFSMSESEDRFLYDKYERCPFNEQHLRKQIAAGGGEVFNDFDELPDGKMHNVYLVTNRPNCSGKFLLSLLNGATILLHLHIIEACRNGLSKRMKLQHVGWSKVLKRWLEPPRNTNKILEGKSVYLLSRDLQQEHQKAFDTFWTMILKKLGAYVVTDLNTEFTEMILANQPPPLEMQESLQAVGSNAPAIVTLEWLKECIFQGHAVNKKLHASFSFKCPSDSS